MELQKLKDLARETGFDAAGVAPVALLSGEMARLRRWIEAGNNAEMGYMARNLDKRENPALLVEGAESVIVTLTNYYTARKQVAGIPRMAKYAWGKDYHLVLKERLRLLLGELQRVEPATGRCFVDSAPVLEHEWARRAGLGWLGKNTLLLNRELGSFCFIGVIVTTAVFDVYDEPFTDSFCGLCNRCVEACPTGALSAHELDARKCISYQTIENKGEYPENLKRLAEGRIFGCDACQEVCPWNRKAKEHRVPEFLPKPEVIGLTEQEWLEMDEVRFEGLFKNMPQERTGLKRILRNL